MSDIQTFIIIILCFLLIVGFVLYSGRDRIHATKKSTKDIIVLLKQEEQSVQIKYELINVIVHDEKIHKVIIHFNNGSITEYRNVKLVEYHRI